MERSASSRGQVGVRLGAFWLPNRLFLGGPMGTPAIPDNPAKAVSLAARALTRAAHTQATAPHDHADFAAMLLHDSVHDRKP